MMLIVSFAPFFHGQLGPLDELELLLAPIVIVITLLVARFPSRRRARRAGRAADRRRTRRRQKWIGSAQRQGNGSHARFIIFKYNHILIAAGRAEERVMKRHLFLKAAVGLMAALSMVGIAAARPLAHERIVSGDYALTLGWLDEPPIVGLKNAALVEVAAAKDDQPVAGAEGSLTAQIVYGGKSKELLLRPLEEKPGSYVGDFIPTRRGTYTLKLGGTINGQPVDVSSEIEEVSTPDSLAFPETQADVQASIEALQSELSTTRMFAIVGAALGTIGLVLAGVALGRSRQ